MLCWREIVEVCIGSEMSWEIFSVCFVIKSHDLNTDSIIAWGSHYLSWGQCRLKQSIGVVLFPSQFLLCNFLNYQVTIVLSSRIYFSAGKSALRQITQRCPSLMESGLRTVLRLWRMRNGLDSGSRLFRRKNRPPLTLSYTAFVLNPPEAARVQGWLDIKSPILSHEAQTIKHVMQCTVQFVWLCIAQARSSPWLLHILLCHSYYSSHHSTVTTLTRLYASNWHNWGSENVSMCIKN